MSDNDSELILALGSNIENRLNNLSIAISELSKIFGTPVASSHVYESKPVDYLKQAKFLNMVLLFKVSKTLVPIELLKITQNLETKLGRHKGNSKRSTQY